MIERWRISAQCLIVHFWAVLGRMDLSFDNWESKLLQQKNLDDMSRNTIGMIKALFANHSKYIGVMCALDAALRFSA